MDAPTPALGLAELQKEAVAFRDRRDWRQFHTPKDLALAISVEAGELAETLLWKSPAEVESDLGQPALRERMADELADVAIYLLYMAEATGIDLTEAILAKIAKNEERYPVDRSRGSARKYTDWS